MIVGASRRLVLKSALPSIYTNTATGRLFSTGSTGLLNGSKRVQLLSSSAKTAHTNSARIGGVTLLHHLNTRHYTTDNMENSGETHPTVTGDTLMTDQAKEHSQELLGEVAQLSTDSVLGSVAQIGDFKAMGLCNFTPVGGLEAMLEAINVYSGVPWWGSIAIATVVVRIALLPLMIKIQRNNARLMNINPDVTRIMANLKASQAGGDAVAIGRYTQEIQTLFKTNECHPMKSLALPIVQMPIMISFFMALRAMAEMPVPGMQDGGLLWFTDLSDKDPYYILPVVSAAGVMAVLEAGSEAGASNPQSKGMKNLFRGLTVVMIPFTAWMPSAVFVYWVTSNAFSIFQIIGLKNQTIRNALNIPKLIKPPAELQKDTKGFFENFKEQQVMHAKSEKDRLLRERQQAAATARRLAKRRF